MGERKRFSSLEGQKALPPSIKAAISKLNRFENLEIGDNKPVLSGSATGRILCMHCGQANEAGREHCWACFKPPAPPQDPAIAKPAPDQEIAVVLNGTAYRSTDPNLPEDVRVLMEWIRREGYSEALLEKWQKWLSSRDTASPQASRDVIPPAADVQAWRGQRVSILRMDGKVYRSDDADLPPEIKEILGYIEQDGVTPALLQHLRLYGTIVKYRPASSPMPSDGDMHFWGDMKKFFKK
jgi:hypothetical protein